MIKPTLADIVNGHMNALLSGYIERHREEILAELRADLETGYAEEWWQQAAIWGAHRSLSILAKSPCGAPSQPDGESIAQKLETPEDGSDCVEWGG